AGSLRWIGTEALGLTTETARRFQERYGHILWSVHATTEVGVVTVAEPADHSQRPGTAGRRLRGTDVRLLDPEGNEVPVGDVGTLHVRGGARVTGADHDRTGWHALAERARVDPEGYYYLEPRHQVTGTQRKMQIG